MEVLLVFHGARARVRQQRKHRAADKGIDAYDRTEVVIVLLDRELIQPSDEQVCLARDVIIGHGRSAARKQVDDIEVIDVPDELLDEIRPRHEQDVRQRDARKQPHGACAVDLRRLEQVFGNVHENARRDEHGIRHADPEVDDENADARQQRVVRYVRKETDPLVYDPPVQKQRIERAVYVQEVVHRQQRDELRNGDGQNEYRAEDRPADDALFIDEQRKQDPREITADRGAERPDERPAQHGKERARDLLARKDLSEHIKPDPIEQRSGRQMLVIVARERHQDHIDERDHRKGKHAQNGHEQHGAVHLLIEERGDVLTEGRGLLPRVRARARGSARLYGGKIDREERDDDEQRANAVEQHQQRIVAVDDERIPPFVHDRVPEFVVAVRLRLRAQRDEPDERVPARQRHKRDKRRLDRKKQQPFDPLPRK